MDNKKDWEEIEKWNKEREETIAKNWEEIEELKAKREEEMKEKYGVDITKLGEKNAQIDMISKAIDKLGKWVEIAVKIVYVIMIIMAFLLVIFVWKTNKDKLKKIDSEGGILNKMMQDSGGFRNILKVFIQPLVDMKNSLHSTNGM